MDKIVGAVKAVYTNYVGFNGRANRGEYWWFILGYIIVVILLALVEGVLLGGSTVMSNLFALGSLIPSLAVGVRRLHDTGHSGWWILIGLIPLIGFIVLIVMSYAKAGEEGSNQYGDGPLNPAL